MPSRGCRITVLKQNYDPSVAPAWVTGPCEHTRVGDVYHTEGSHRERMPAGFCYVAWQALQQFAVTLSSGGKVFGEYESYTGCCPNGARPVVFLLEPDDAPEAAEER